MRRNYQIARMSVPATPAWKALCGYGSATLLQGFVAFMAVPMMIRVLGARDFALWAIFEPLALLLAQLSLLGSSHAYIRLLASGKAGSADVYHSQLRFGMYPCVLICCLGGFASVVGIGLGSLWSYVPLAALLIFLEAAILLCQSVDRGESDAFGYAQTIWVKFGALGIGLVLASWAGVRLELIEFAGALIVIDSVVLMLSFVRFRRHCPRADNTGPSRTRDQHWAAVRYGLPIVAASGLAVVAANGDRYLVHALMQSGDLPGYMIMAKLAGAMSFAAAPINLWWPAARFRHANDSDCGAAFFASATFVLLWYYLAVAAVAWALAPHFVGFYAQGVSGYDANTMGLLLCAAVATAMITPINIGILDEGRTHWIAASVGVGAFAGLTLSGLLIPRYGYVGAGLGSFSAQCTALLFTYWISQRIQAVPMRFGKLIALVLGFGFAALVIRQDFSPWAGFGAALLFMLLGAAVCANDFRRLLGS